MSLPVERDDAARLRTLARLMDSAFRIPGTGVTVGLDSIVGLVPGIGDLAGGVMSAYIVLAAARLGAPASVIARMILNLGADTLVGSVPLLGDLFDVGFRANIRNVDLLDRHLAQPAAARRSSRIAVGAAIAGVVVLAGIGIVIAVLAARVLNHFIR